MVGEVEEVRDATWLVVELGLFVGLLVAAVLKVLGQRGSKGAKSSTPSTSHTREEQVQGAVEQAFASAAAREGKVVLRLELAALPNLKKTYEGVTELTLPMASSDMDLAPLKKLPNLHTLKLRGPPLKLDHIAVLKQMPSITSLLLADSRVVVYANNSIEGFCKPKVCYFWRVDLTLVIELLLKISPTLPLSLSPVGVFVCLLCWLAGLLFVAWLVGWMLWPQDIFEFARDEGTRQLNKLELPQKAAYEIGKIVKVFKKPKVVVVSVAKSLAVGDVVFFQRTVQNFAAA